MTRLFCIQSLTLIFFVLFSCKTKKEEVKTNPRIEETNPSTPLTPSVPKTPQRNKVAISLKTNAPDEDVAYGIDINPMYQGINIDFGKVKNAGFEFVFIKVSEGKNFNKKVMSSKPPTEFLKASKILADSAKANGLKIGYYHFARPTTNSASAEANFFMNSKKQLPTPDLPDVIDFEASSIETFVNLPNFGKNKVNQKYLENWIDEYLRIIQKDHSSVLLYGYKGIIDCLPLDHKLGDMPLWIAYYTYPFSYPESPNKVIPKGWNDWKIWQYCEMGFVDGVLGGKTEIEANLDFLIKNQVSIMEKTFVFSKKKNRIITLKKPPGLPYTDLNLMKRSFFNQYNK
jgi:GH25 family lysozyme M1 (1,4-beta-N-acetylmuramidase)